MPRLRAFARNILRRSRVERDLDRELRDYRALLEEEKLAAGLPADVARREAALEAGNADAIKDAVRDVRAGALAEQLAQDVRYGLRMLRRSPVFTTVAVATLALGIGANAAIFTLVNAIVLRPLPFAAPDQLFAVEGMSYTGEFLELQQRARSFDVAAVVTRQATLTGDGEPVRLAAASISANAMPLLGTAAARGRTLLPADEQAASRVVVISHQLWTSRFGGRDDIVGRGILIDGVLRTVVGVMPADFGFPARATGLWTPSVIDRADRIGLWSTSRRMIGRLRGGASMAQADAEVKALAPSMGGLFPWRMPADYGRTARALPLHESTVGGIRVRLLTLLGAVAMVLLIASVNISNLLVARTLARQREMAIRASLGASRGRILRQVLTEGTLLVALGTVVGAGVAAAALQGLPLLLPVDLPRDVAATADPAMLGHAVAVLVLTALIVAVLPALRASRADLTPRLAAGERTGPGRGARRASNLLIGAQVALCATLLVAAALFVRTLLNLQAVETGFAAEQLVTARISPPTFRFADPASRRDLYERLVERLQQVPGVSAAALTDRLPFSDETFGSVFIIEGRPDPSRSGEWPMADVSGIASPGLFTTLGASVEEGREFTPADTAASRPVAVISRGLARRYWPGESPIGRRVTFPGDRTGFRTIVGVVGDITWTRAAGEPSGALFVPVAQAAPGTMRVVVRTTGDEGRALARIKDVVRSVDAVTPVDRAAPMTAIVAESVGQPRFTAVLVSGFAVLGLLLAAIGIYGTLADHVTERRREIGVRLALGAQRGDVIRVVLGRTLAVVAAGIVVGLLAAAMMTRVVSGLLFGVESTDPVAFVTAAVLLMCTAAAGGLIPARRASRLDPLRALRLD